MENCETENIIKFMDDIFNMQDVVIERPKMSSDDFVKNTKLILNKIFQMYSECWYNRVITDEETNLAPCDNCTGCNNFKNIDGTEINCAIDYENGYCTERAFDSELFVENIEEIFYDNKSSLFFDLIECEIEN